MKILYVVPYSPTAIRTRPFNFMRCLAARGHEVTLATLWETPAEREFLSGLDHGVRVIAFPLTKVHRMRNTLRAMVSGDPLQAAYSWQPALVRAMTGQVMHSASKYDVIHVEHLRGAAYGLNLKQKLAAANGEGPGRVPIVWDSVDCISFLFEQATRSSRNLFGRVVTRFELPRTRRMESELLHAFEAVLLTSESDRKAFLEIERANGSNNRHANLIVLPNGVDLGYFAPSKGMREPSTLVMTGKLSYHANVTAALYLVDQIMPHVWAKQPQVRVELVGYKPVRQVLELEQKQPGRVSVVGNVQDLRPYLARAALSVAPILYGAGIQNKVLEAMAMATPVVATPAAVSALNVKAEKEILLGNNPEQFANQLLRLLSDPAMREHIGDAGRRYVEANHDWDRITEQLEKVYESVISQPKPAVG